MPAAPISAAASAYQGLVAPQVTVLCRPEIMAHKATTSQGVTVRFRLFDMEDGRNAMHHTHVRLDVHGVHPRQVFGAPVKLVS